MAKKKSDIDWSDFIGFLKAVVGFGLIVGFATAISYGITLVTDPSDPGFVVGENSSKQQISNID